jgi:transposase
MKAIRVPPLNAVQRDELDRLYRTAKVPRWRTRAQRVLRSAERELNVFEIAAIVRESDDTVASWLKRYLAEGLDGLKDAPRPGRPSDITEDYRSKLLAAVRRRPRSWDLPYSLGTCPRLSDYLAEETGQRVSLETLRPLLKRKGIVLSCPQHKISSPAPEPAVKKRRWKTRVTS